MQIGVPLLTWMREWASRTNCNGSSRPTRSPQRDHIVQGLPEVVPRSRQASSATPLTATAA
eukprot:846122-Alexandrium_andersonii.AAC.1